MSDTTRPAPPVIEEIATINDGRDITRGYVDALPLLPSQDVLLRAKGGGNLAIYEEVLRDDMVKATFEQRRLALCATEWRIEPGGAGRIDRKAADALKSTLSAVDFDGVTDKMLYGIFYGFAVGECVWNAAGGLVVLDGIKVRRQKRFGFAPDGSLRMLTSSHPLGEPVPEWKFWHFRCGADNDDEPYGLGLAHWLYWPVYFKRAGMKAWTSFLDKFAQPTVVGEFPVGTAEGEKGRLLNAVASVKSQSGLIIPQGMVVRLLEATRGGKADYLDLTELMNRAIARLVLTQTMTSSDGASLSQAEVHERMLQRIVQADGNLVAGSFNRTIARWLTEWNFPGARPPRLVFMTDESEDLDKRANREKVITETTGLRPTRKHIEEVYGGEWEEGSASSRVTPIEVPLVTSREAQQAQTPREARFAEIAEADGQMAVDHVDLGNQLQIIAEALVTPLLERIRDGVTPEELLNALGEMYPAMDYSRLTALLDRVVFVGETWGRIDATRG
ncbi:MAG: DUF935 family protein [Magnetococcales bacterium]|nr:DUF935 family protein [Magnetococcales bacterium]